MFVQFQSVNPRMSNWNTKFILNSCMNHMIRVSGINHLTLLLVVTMRCICWFLWRAIWTCVSKGCFGNDIFWRAKSCLKGIEDFNLEHRWHHFGEDVLAIYPLNLNRWLNCDPDLTIRPNILENGKVYPHIQITPSRAQLNFPTGIFHVTPTSEYMGAWTCLFMLFQTPLFKETVEPYHFIYLYLLSKGAEGKGRA